MEKKNTTTKTRKKQNLTLLQAIETVAVSSKDSKMSADFLKASSPEIKFLAEQYGISERQAVIFAICMDEGPNRVDYHDLARHLDLGNIAVLAFAKDIDALVHRRLLRYRDVKDEDDFDVPAAVIRCLKHNEVYQLPIHKGLDCAGVFEVLNQWFDDLNDDAIGPKELIEEIHKLFDDNPKVAFGQKVKQLRLDETDELLLIKFCYYLICNDDNDIRFNQMENVFYSTADFNNAKAALRSDGHTLQTAKLIEFRCEDGIVNNTQFKLTEDAKRDLLAELKINTTEEHLADVIESDQLTPKTMFYTETVQHQVEELNRFFEPEQYAKIRERMQQRGFRQGFTCLFHGGPGTGKTETVYQLARLTGRSIMTVDVPSIKSKWVGDSEKNIKALFDRYRSLVQRAEKAPILLFNEADAIFGIRKAGAEDAVDKMENTIQNIILQEMETLDGIMIATTNLTENLDSAFERRFLYKIRFDKPDATVRGKIWQQMIPELNDSDAATLAEHFDFSGGQIENVARKHAINSILYGTADEMLPVLESYCRCEQLNNGIARKRIGF
ncbi:MAG: ATP-binding protein [Bacteroidales bacterium]|nr:ATP-binding protein [Bacteroidales bacterium]